MCEWKVSKQELYKLYSEKCTKKRFSKLSLDNLCTDKHISHVKFVTPSRSLKRIMISTFISSITPCSSRLDMLYIVNRHEAHSLKLLNTFLEQCLPSYFLCYYKRTPHP